MSSIVARECKHVFYSKSNEPGDYSDYHLVKEIQFFDDGTSKPALTEYINLPRSFYVTKKGAQNHEQKKEWELLENVIEFKSTQSELARSVAKALGTPWAKGSVKQLSISPYLYGTDISSTALLKQKYIDKWNKRTKNTVAVFDTETDMIHGTGQIIMATLSMKDKVLTVISKDFLSGQANAIPRIHTLANKILDKYIRERNITLDIRIVDTEIDIVKTIMQAAHKWVPDFIAVWNIEFDMTKIIEACSRAGEDIAKIMSDPSVPDKYKSFKFKKGPSKKVTASGDEIPIKPSARWHAVMCPASFTWIDAMCSYRHIRNGEPEESEYSLDAILQKKAGITKLRIPGAQHLEGAPWHTYAQTNHPLVYIVYNMFDCVSMEILDEITNDLSISLPLFSGCSDYADFKSQPKRTSDKKHFYTLSRGRVICSVSEEMKTDYDDEVASLSEWIIMLQSYLVEDNGIKCVLENQQLRTNIRIGAVDLDVEGSYPNGGVALNISKETTSKEVISVEGVDETTRRMCTINLSAGHVNSLEICNKLFGMPTLDAMLDAFLSEQDTNFI